MATCGSDNNNDCIANLDLPGDSTVDASINPSITPPLIPTTDS